MKDGKALPLVYACSGASSAAQMANHLALRLDRLQVAEMSCIAGLGGDVPSLVRTACSGRALVAIDGCRLHCVARTLERHGLRAHAHIDLTNYDVRKRMHADFDPEEAARILNRILDDPSFPRRSQPAGAAASPTDRPDRPASSTNSGT